MSDSEEDDDDVGDPDFQLRNSTLTSESESDEEDDLFEVVLPKKRGKTSVMSQQAHGIEDAANISLKGQNAINNCATDDSSAEKPVVATSSSSGSQDKSIEGESTFYLSFWQLENKGIFASTSTLASEDKHR